MTSETDEYQRGLRDGRADGIQAGRIEALERRQDHHESRVDGHERRLVLIERIIWGMAGVLFLSSIWPQVGRLLGAMADK